MAIFRIISTFLIIFSVSALVPTDSKKNLSTDAKKDEIDSATYQKYHVESEIGDGLFKGNILIYVCSKGHYACVNKYSMSTCENDPNLGCILVKKNKDQKECFEEQFAFMNKSKIKNFCFN